MLEIKPQWISALNASSNTQLYGYCSFKETLSGGHQRRPCVKNHRQNTFCIITRRISKKVRKKKSLSFIFRTCSCLCRRKDPSFNGYIFWRYCVLLCNYVMKNLIFENFRCNRHCCLSKLLDIWPQLFPGYRRPRRHFCRPNANTRYKKAVPFHVL